MKNALGKAVEDSIELLENLKRRFVNERLTDERFYLAGLIKIEFLETVFIEIARDEVGHITSVHLINATDDEMYGIMLNLISDIRDDIRDYRSYYEKECTEAMLGMLDGLLTHVRALWHGGGKREENNEDLS